MVAAIVGSTVGVGVASGNSITFTKPPLQDGDQLLVVIRGSSSAATVDFTCAGWGRQGPAFVPNDSVARILGMYTKPIPSAAAESATSYTFTYTGTAGRISGEIVAVRGVDPTTPIQTSSAPNYDSLNPSNGVSRLSSMTATKAGLLVGVATNEVVSPNSSTPTPPTGTTLLGISESTTGTGATRSVTALFSQRVTAGPTGILDTTWLSSSSPSTHAVIFNDAPVAPTAPVVEVSNGDGTSTSAGVYVFDGTTAVPAADVLALNTRSYTVAQMLAEMTSAPPVYAAHRGGSLNFSEMTMRAYTNALWHGTKILEYSAQRTSDGVFVGFHDATVDRTTALSGNVSAFTWAQLNGVAVDAPLADGGTVSRLEDLLDTYGQTHVLFIEDKTYANLNALMALIEAHVPNPTQHVVLKFSGPGSGGFADLARARGYTTWASYGQSDAPGFSDASHFDILSMDVTADATSWGQIVALGKPMWGHIIDTTAAAATATGRGAKGLMTSGVLAVVPKVNDLP
jgi:hypothetical protein